MSCKVWLRLYFCEASPRKARLRLDLLGCASNRYQIFFSPLYFLRPLMESSASGLAPPGIAPLAGGEGCMFFSVRHVFFSCALFFFSRAFFSVRHVFFSRAYLFFQSRILFFFRCRIILHAVFLWAPLCFVTPITHVSAIPTIAAFLCAENRNSSVRRFSGAARPRGEGGEVYAIPPMVGSQSMNLTTSKPLGEGAVKFVFWEL
jgi:hypothetical protein